MARDALRVADVESLLRLSGEVGEIAAGGTARVDHAVRTLCEMTRARVGATVQFVTDADHRPTAINPATAHLVGVDRSELAAHGDSMTRAVAPHPLRLPFVGSRSPVLTLRRVQVLPDAEWYRHPYVNEILRRQNCDDVILSRLIRPDLRLDAIIAVCRDFGDRPFSERDRLVTELFHTQILPRLFPAARAMPPLPARLRPVLDCLLVGDSEKQVALRLNLSPHTVHQYVKTLYRTLGVNSRGELLARCLNRPKT